MVFETDEFRTHSSSFTRLNRRNSSLKRQRKNSEDLKLTDREENEFQSTLTLMRNLKRIILQVSAPSHGSDLI